jgi:hypothetical protein
VKSPRSCGLSVSPRCGARTRERGDTVIGLGRYVFAVRLYGPKLEKHRGRVATHWRLWPFVFSIGHADRERPPP